MEYTWKIKETTEPNTIKKLADTLNVPEIVAKLLSDRGIYSFDEAKQFFRPSLSELHDPFLMEDMDLAVERLETALYKKEKIMVYGDYDVDGSTSVALMVSFLKKLTTNVLFYQPDRYGEGYGVSNQGMELAKKQGVALIIALDCGTKDLKALALAKEYQIDVIVCDHHTPGDTLPEAYAILNPKKESCVYPYSELCGCGIGFKLIQGFAGKQGWKIEDILEYLDLVTVAIGADIVPMTGENRILAYFGLQIINDTPRLGIQKLLETRNRKGDSYSISDLVFTIAPRVNAAGRIAHANAAVEMLLVEDEKMAEESLLSISSLNTERKELDKGITEHAMEILVSDPFYATSKSTVIWDASWHKGVVGIVASRLIETYYKPTLVLALKDGEATGSARSVSGFDVYAAIEKCADLLTKFGGHKYAAGLSLKEENLLAFRERFEEVVAASITEDQQTPFIQIDGEIVSEDLLPDIHGNPLPKLFRIFNQFAPFGPQNMKPTLLLKNLECTGHSRIVGENHLKLSLRCKRTQMLFSGIAFGLANKHAILDNQAAIDVVFNLDVNHFMNQTELQLLVKDLKPSGSI